MSYKHDPGMLGMEGAEEQTTEANLENEYERSKPKPRLREANREQGVLIAIDVEKLISEEHDARAIWEMIKRLDLSIYLGKIRSVEGVAGRSAYDPRVLLTLWIYAYSKGESSSRKIEELCGHDPAYMWITGLKVIGYHTISSFRSKHREALNDIFVQLVGVLGADGLVSLERVTLDGTKVKANASRKSFRRKKRIDKFQEEARKQIEVMEALEQDEESQSKVNKAKERAAREWKEKLDLATEELQKIQSYKNSRSEPEEARVSTTDPECRVMRFGSDGGIAPAYNVQLSTDAATGIIVAAAATSSPNDTDELMPAVQQIEENTNRKPEQIVTDTGYPTRENIIEMEKAEIDFIAPMGLGVTDTENQLKRWGIDPAFAPSSFRYDETKNRMICPAGKEMKLCGKEFRSGVTRHRYQAKRIDCNACPNKALCCPHTDKGRTITRLEDDPVVAEFKRKMSTEEAKATIKQRGPTAEFVNAWIKEKFGLREFSMRGLTKVDMEVKWVSITYNIKQWIRQRWRPLLASAIY